MSCVWIGRILSAVVFLVGAGWVLHEQLPSIKHELNGYSFPETLKSTVEADGEDVPVVFILVRDEDFSFSVLKENGEVQDRFYGSVCQAADRSAGTSCAVRATHHEHRSTSRERELAQVRLGDIDPDVVARLRRESGVPKATAIGLRGRNWVIGGFPRSAERGFVADLDGSDLHRPRTVREQELAQSVAEDSGVKRHE